MMEILIQSLVVFIAFTVFNFVSIHSMANIVLYQGSSRKKSLSISGEFALLSATYSFVALLVIEFLDITSPTESLSFLPLAIVLAGYLLFVELFRIWYVHREYDTTWLYAFLISEGFMIFLQGAFLILRNMFFA